MLYSQYTETFNAYGAADLKERRHNPNANQFITNHQMGADVVAAAAPHIGKELFYTKPEDNRRLRDGGYGNGNPNDNSYFPNKPSFAISPAFSSLSVGNSLGAMVATHRVTNFTDEGGLSVLSPKSNAAALAKQTSYLFEEFRQDVRKTAKESPQQFEWFFKQIDNYLTENKPFEPNPYEQQNQPQYAQTQPASFSDMPEAAQKICNQCKTLLAEFDQEEGITRSKEERDAIATAMGIKAYADGLPEAHFMHIQDDGQINIGYESAQGKYLDTSIHTSEALSTPMNELVAQSKQAENNLAQIAEQHAQAVAAYRTQSSGYSYG